MMSVLSGIPRCFYGDSYFFGRNYKNISAYQREREGSKFGKVIDSCHSFTNDLNIKKIQMDLQ